MDEITKYPEGSVVRPYICRFTWFFLFIQSHCRLFSGALMAWWWPWPHTPSLLETWLCTWWQMLWSLHPLNRSWLSSHVQYLPQAEEEFAVVWSRWLWCRLGSTTSTAHLEEDFSRGPNARSAMTQCPWSRKHQGFCSTVGQLGVAGAWLSDQWPRTLTTELPLPEALVKTGILKPLALLGLIHSVFPTLWCTWAMWGLAWGDLGQENRDSGLGWPESSSLTSCSVARSQV